MQSYFTELDNTPQIKEMKEKEAEKLSIQPTMVPNPIRIKN
jgi:hypothetical protein